MEKSLSEEAITEELAQMTGDDKAEMIAIWLKNPHISIFELSEVLAKKTGKSFSVQVLHKEFELLGLSQVSESKKAELAQTMK